MFIKILTGVYYIFHLVFLCKPSCVSSALHWYQDLLFQICYNVHEEPHCDVLHLPSSILHIPSCALGASSGCTACNCQQVHYVCRYHHVIQEPHLSVRHLAIKCTTESIMYIRSLTWVHCICQQVHCISHQVYCRGHLLTSEATLGCTSGASLGCTADTII